MLKVFMNHPGFEKIKDHHLDIDTSHKLSKVLEQITSKVRSTRIIKNF